MTRPLRVLISGGGTAGHVNPALTVAEVLRAEGAEVLFVGTRDGLEADLVPRAGFRLEFIRVAPLMQQPGWKKIRGLTSAFAGVAGSVRIIRRFRPHVAVGTGGYVTGPVLLAAVLLRVPTVIHEQNAVIGATNRLLARWVDRIAFGYAEAARGLRTKDKPIHVGNPVRPEVLQMERSEGIRRLGLRPDRLTLLIFGGSRGAKSINDAVWTARDALLRLPGVQIVHQTGAAGFAAQRARYEAVGVRPAAEDRIDDGPMRVVPYIYDMPSALAAADVVVSRAGAISVAEITARGIPAVLIPFPYAAEDHQTHNARPLEKAGAARVIPDAELTGERLTAELLPILRDAELRRRMAAAARSLGRPEAARELVELIKAAALRRRRESQGS